METVSLKQYLEKYKRYGNNLYTLELDGWEVPFLHGLMVLAANHPDHDHMSALQRETILQVRTWCCEVFKTWGFSPEQVEWLDKTWVDANLREVAVADSSK
jgi:hypothetical protein